MSVFKCKMCGGTIEFEPGATIGTCDSCGTVQTLPRLDDDRKANLYDRADHFRRNNDYDKAMGIYEQILNEDNTDAEAYWSLVLCRYGIEYVEDPATHKRVPTVNRAQFTSVFADEDYRAAIAHADGAQREIYEAEAKTIDEIQKGILAISEEEEPFDVFICYKETDESGKRTVDSTIANDIYYQLTQEGFKVFFAAITLEDKLGQEYEPYIFAALNSARVMIVIGSKPEYLNAVWVKNEWSRYLALMAKDRKRLLIPCYRDMDPYDLPEELSSLQSQDMNKIGFMQDLLRGVRKVLDADKNAVPPKGLRQAAATAATNTEANPSVANLLKRAAIFLEDGDFKQAAEYYNRVLDIDAECASAYVGKVCVAFGLHKETELAYTEISYANNPDWKKAMRFADAEQQDAYQALFEQACLFKGYKDAKERYKTNQDNAAELALIAVEFEKLGSYKDAEALRQNCLDRVEKICSSLYNDIVNDIKEAGDSLERWDEIRGKLNEPDLNGYRDVDKLREQAENRYNECYAAMEKEWARREKIKRKKAAAAAAVKAKKRRRKYICLIVAVIVVEIAYISVKFLFPWITYKTAEQMRNEGRYEQAVELFDGLDDFMDAETQISETLYMKAGHMRANGEYDQAVKLYEQLGGYSDAESQIKETKYQQANYLTAQKDYTGAAEIFITIKGYKDVERLIESDENLSAAAATAREAKWRAGNYVTFGTYPQTKAGNDTTPIEWLVLARDGDKALVISRYALDCIEYNTKYTSVTWETCSLRTWLNNDFYNKAFSAEEKASIVLSKVTADKNPTYSTPPGNDTNDNVFLLSITEANNYFEDKASRRCAPTDYAVKKGAFTSSIEKVDGRVSCCWWLRSPGMYGSIAAVVGCVGSVYSDGDYVGSSDCSVRPCVWVRLF